MSFKMFSGICFVSTGETVDGSSHRKYFSSSLLPAADVFLSIWCNKGMIEDFYRGGSVLLTGCTGFLAKIILEKLLFSVSTVAKIYVLIRPKKGTDISERLRKEILESPCFDRLRSAHSDFQQFVEEKVQAVSGDLLKEDLALNAEDRNMLMNSVTVVIHCASCVDFNLRLDQALQINVLGALRLFAFAKTFPLLKSYVHVSTAYANSDKTGRIEEKLYPSKSDPMAQLRELARFSSDEIERNTKKLLGRFPNTYTFTKALCENALRASKENAPLVIVRPSVLGACWMEPFPGWVDKLSACGIIYLLTGLGLLKIANARSSNIADIIPTDLVSSACICAAARYSRSSDLPILHLTSSSINPTTWLMAKDTMVVYWRKNPPEKAVSKASFSTYENPIVYKTVSFLRRRLPYFLYKSYASISQNPERMKTAQRYRQMLERERNVANTLSYFILNEWIFSAQRLVEMFGALNKAEKAQFPMDLTMVSWKAYFTNYTYGIHKWILKEKVERPVDPENLDLNMDSIKIRYFEDLMWSINQPISVTARPVKEMKFLILNSDRVQKTIRSLAATMSPADGHDANVRKLHKTAEDMLTRMCSDLRPGMVRLFSWVLRKIWRLIYEKIVIDPKAILKLQRLHETKKGPLILAPTHRSYVDFLIISYLLFAYNIRVPYIAAGEDFLHIVLVNHVLRMSGAFFIKRKIMNNKLYQAILTEYVQRLLKDDQSVEFFVEGTRSRSGKTLAPKFGMLGMCTDLLFDRTIPQLHVVPITINYERVLEGETFPFELLGEEKVKESLSRIVKAAKILNMNFGKIFINFGKVIDVTEFAGKFPELKPYEKEADKRAITVKLGYEIVYSFQQNLVIMPTAMIAAILLMNRRGMGEDELVAQGSWLRDEVKSHGYRLGGMSSGTSSTSVRNALQHIGDTVHFKKEIFDQTISVKPDYKSMLLLSYYRNALAHIFYQEAFCVCALNGFGEKLAFNEGLQRGRLSEETLFLSSLFQIEYVARTPLQTTSDASALISLLLSRGVFESQGENIRVAKGKELHISFLCSLIWPLVDTFWTTVMFAFGLKMRQAVPLEKLLHGIQMFAEHLYEERVISFYESCALETIKNDVNVLTTLKILEKTQSGDIKLIRLAADLNSDESRLQELLDHVGMFKKAAFTKTMTSADEMRKTLLSEFAFTGPKL